MPGSPKPWELAKIGVRLNQTMPDLLDVYRRTGNTDRWGGGAEEVRVLEDVPCGVAPVQAGPGTLEGVESDVVAYNVVVPTGYFIRQGDRLEITTLGGQDMQVVNVERADSYDVMIRLQAVQTGSAVTQ